MGRSRIMKIEAKQGNEAYTYSDGVGQISREFMRAVSVMLKLNNKCVPSCIQVNSGDKGSRNIKWKRYYLIDIVQLSKNDNDDE